MAEPLYTTILQHLHVGGGWLAFGAAPVALLALKGSRRHILAGRCFLLALTTGITAGLTLAAIDGAVGLISFGLLALFLLGAGYLAPRIGRGSSSSYRLDRAKRTRPSPCLWWAIRMAKPRNRFPSSSPPL